MVGVAAIAIVAALVFVIAQAGITAGTEAGNPLYGLAFGIGLVLSLLTLVPGVVLLLFGLFLGHADAGVRLSFIGAALFAGTCFGVTAIEDRVKEVRLRSMLMLGVLAGEVITIGLAYSNATALMYWIFKGMPGNPY